SNNPAGMVLQGARYDVGVGLFAPMRSYTATGAPAPGCSPGGCTFSIGDGNQSIDSDNELFLIPQFGYNWVLDPDSSIGISVYGNGGMNTEYKGGTATLFDGVASFVTLPGTFGANTAGVDLSQLFFSTTYSARLSPTTSWGISGIVAYQRFEADGLANFAPFSTDPNSLSNNGHDTSTGIGVRLGIQTEVSPGIRLGAAYQPEIEMSEFDDYAGLFAEKGDFDIPSNLTIGAAFDIGQDGVLVVDLQQINYEDVPSVSNPIQLLFTDCMPGVGGPGCLGGSNGAGFGWQDIQVVKVGYQWQDGDMTWRVGVSVSEQPIPKEEIMFNILAPGVIEETLTFGFTRQLDAKSALSFAAMYAPSVSVKGTNTFDPAQQVELEMDQYEFVLSYNRSL
ncbi:MAG: outer membrane protein transport protein, partial [Gammaproteobacteria bacterium]|nr:outer membrane protein transport protein [Gammaproteobacteria bacterium]